MKPNRRFRLSVTATVVGAAMLLAACGSSTSGDGASAAASGSPADPIEVKVGVFAAADVAPLYLGMREGYFKEHGLDVKVQMLDSGSAVSAAVVSGGIDFGYSNYLSLLIANSRGLPVTVVAPGVTGGTDAKTGEGAFTAVMVAKDSPITDIKDLKGKTVAVNALGNILEVTLKNAFEKNGINPADVKLVEVPFPEMPGALAAHRIDAAFMIEPFVTTSKETDGTKAVAYPYEIVAPAFQTGGYFTTENLIKDKPNEVKAFQAALKQSTEYALAHEDQVRAIIPDFLKIPKNVVDKISLPKFVENPDVSHIKILGDLGKRYGLLKGEANMDKLMAGLPKS